MVQIKKTWGPIAATLVAILGADPGAATLSVPKSLNTTLAGRNVDIPSLGPISSIPVCALGMRDCQLPTAPTPEPPAAAATPDVEGSDADRQQARPTADILICVQGWDACQAPKPIFVKLAVAASPKIGRPDADMPLGAVVNIPFCQEPGDCNVAKTLSFDRPDPGRFEFEMPRIKKTSLFGLPKLLKPQPDSIVLDKLTLAPMAHSMFCVQNPSDCQVKKIAFRGGRYALTSKRWQDLREVNAGVNVGIRPERNALGLAGEQWLIAPTTGDCNDYAVTKRHELLARGWPSRTLLLAEVVTNWGEHHVVLLVRTGEGDFVLDNLNANIRPWSKAPYQWVRVQSPRNPQWWSTVRSADA